MINLPLSPMIEMALEEPPTTNDGKRPCLFYASMNDGESPESYIADIEEALVGRWLDPSTFETVNGWTILFKHSLDRAEIDVFGIAMREREDYVIVETWAEYRLQNPEENLPRLVAFLEDLQRSQIRH